MRKCFTVIIEGKEKDVWDIEGKEQDAGNGEPLTWWIYMGDRLPDGLTPPEDSDNWVHWHSSVQRQLWDIKIVQRNTTKEKWDSIRFNSSTRVEMFCNGKLVYGFGSHGSPGGLSFAMAKIQYLQTMLSEHPYNFFNPEENNGRKIFWYGLPATVKVHSSSPWEISIIPDYETGLLSKEEWWKELKNRESKVGGNKYEDDDESEKEDHEENMQLGYINWGDALSDQYINWFRK